MFTSVLAVEDDALNRAVLFEMLKVIAPGLDVTFVVDGVEAIEAIKAQDFALILTDINMPRMDGKELLTAIRAEVGAKTPVIAITALAVLGDREKLLTMGFDDYISKPIDMRVLQTTLERFVTLSIAP